MAYKILVLKGDGIGPEVVGEALQILKIIARLSAVDLEFKEGMIGGHALDTSGTPLPGPTRAYFEPLLGQALSAVRVHTARLRPHRAQGA